MMGEDEQLTTSPSMQCAIWLLERGPWCSAVQPRPRTQAEREMPTVSSNLNAQNEEDRCGAVTEPLDLVSKTVPVSP